MDNSGVYILTNIFSSIWSALGNITVPTTNLTGQHLLVAPFGAVVFVSVLKKILDIGAVSSSTIVGIQSHVRSEKMRAQKVSRKEEK